MSHRALVGIEIKDQAELDHICAEWNRRAEKHNVSPKIQYDISNAKIVYIYVHGGGYLGKHGIAEALKKKFNDRESALKLIAGGFTSYVDSDGTIGYYNEEDGHPHKVKTQDEYIDEGDSWDSELTMLWLTHEWWGYNTPKSARVWFTLK